MHTRKPWAAPRRRLRCAGRERCGKALRKAGKIAAGLTLLGLKMTRAVLQDGISRLEKDLHPPAPDQKPYQRIDIQ